MHNMYVHHYFLTFINQNISRKLKLFICCKLLHSPHVPIPDGSLGSKIWHIPRSNEKPREYLKNNIWSVTFSEKEKKFIEKFILDSTIVTTAHQNASGIDLKKDISVPASAKYTADENKTTPFPKWWENRLFNCLTFRFLYFSNSFVRYIKKYFTI